jgi:two-component system cell cycle sensor histidine kinase/response regulator CckA
MKNQPETSLWIRLAGIGIIGLFIALAAAAYLGGQQVKRSSDLITTDAVPGVIAAHDMRMAMSRSVGYMMVAASAQTTQSRDASIKIVHDADMAFTNAVTQYETTIKINPAEDRALLNEVTSRFAEFQRQRMTYEALILAGNRDGSAAFLETNLVPSYVTAMQSAEELLKYNNGNSITYANYIRNSVQLLYLAVAVVMVLALICAGVLVANFAIRRREVKELRESEERFSKAFRSSPSGIVITEMETGKYVEVNESYCRIMGYSPQELIGRTSVEIRFWSSEKERDRSFKSLLAGNPLRDLELQTRTRDGDSKTILANAELIELGGKKSIVSMVQDITERKKAEEALREKQAQLMLAMEIAKLAHWEFDVEKKLIIGDENIFRMMGTTSVQEGGLSMSPEEYIRKFVHPSDAALVANEVALGVSTTDPNFARQFEHRVIRKDRTEGVMMTRSRILHGAAGRTIKIFGTSQDITEQKRAQDELIWKTALLEAQVDSTLDGILVVDTMGKKILQNQRFLEMLKVPTEIARDDDDANMLQHAAKQMKNPQQFRERVIYLYGHPDEISLEEIELADGRIFDRYSSPVRDKAGKHFGRIWAFRDITKQRTLEHQFRQSQKMEAVGQLASGVAHDFNNILGIIQMQSDLLKLDGTLSPKQAGFASEIGEAAQRAAALTRQLLLFSRKEKMQTRELDLNQSISDMTKMLRRTLGENIQLQFKFAMQPLFVNADAGMMDQVLMNLSVNARDAMPQGGKIVIEISAVEFDESIKDQYAQASPGSFVCLSVSDTGTGIPAEILPKIFEPFFTTKDVGKGTGLGLATVFGIVQQHQGWINVYSEIGQGTSFRIYFPRLARISDQKFVAPTTEPMPGGKETILVVEDEPKLRASVVNFLSGLSYNVLEASDGASAIEAWKKHRAQVLLAKNVWNQHRDEIHLLLTDMVMPGGMSGKDLGELLLKENIGLKVIYVSGYSAEVAAKDFPLQEGVNFLTKPFQAQKLAQAIRNSLDEV